MTTLPERARFVQEQHVRWGLVPWPCLGGHSMFFSLRFTRLGEGMKTAEFDLEPDYSRA